MPTPAAVPAIELAHGGGRLKTAGTVLFYVTLALLVWLCCLRIDHHHGRVAAMLGIGAIALWRYTWLSINVGRSFWYRFVRFPALRARADRIPLAQACPECLHIIIPTYQEQPWVTRRMLLSVTREAASLPCPVGIYLATGSSEEDVIARDALAACPSNDHIEVFLLRQNGKRSGMAYALRAAARHNGNRRSLVVLMDGDTVFGPGLLAKCLPFFKMNPRLGGVTTNNIALTRGPGWYREWYALRFALRNRYMCSASLSRRLLTLTGRFSVFHGEVALSDDFIERIEADYASDWLHGRFQLKTGDDKSTWFCLLQQGWEMLYVPDAWIYCMENAGPRPARESIGKMRRWFGNMLRTNGRALALGPQRIGVFVWLMLLDQRISMWTSLVMPTTAILLSIAISPFILLYFLIWIFLSRVAYLFTLALEGHALSLLDLPLLLYQQWIGSLVKIQAMSDLRRQQWSASRGDAGSGAPVLFAHVQTALLLTGFVLLVAMIVL
jgi:glycosyltransferase Alg8